MSNVVELDKFVDGRGDLYVLESGLFWDLKYKYYYIVYDVKDVVNRANVNIIVLRGSVKIGCDTITKGTALFDVDVKQDNEFVSSMDFIGLLLTNITNFNLIPVSGIDFNVKRIFFVDNMPIGALRGQHAHKVETEFLFAVKGAFNVEIKHGKKFFGILKEGQSAISLPEAWTSVESLSEDSLLLAFLSHNYDATGFV